MAELKEDPGEDGAAASPAVARGPQAELAQKRRGLSKSKTAGTASLPPSNPGAEEISVVRPNRKHSTKGSGKCSPAQADGRGQSPNVRLTTGPCCRLVRSIYKGGFVKCGAWDNTQ